MIQPGQVFRSCDPRGGPHIRIETYRPGSNRAHIVDAATGKRFRQILVTALHDSDTTRAGTQRRTGYVLEPDGCDRGPSVGECRDFDRNWDVEKAGET